MVLRQSPEIGRVEECSCCTERLHQPDDYADASTRASANTYVADANDSYAADYVADVTNADVANAADVKSQT